jgi:hypothetical protein
LRLLAADELVGERALRRAEKRREDVDPEELSSAGSARVLVDLDRAGAGKDERERADRIRARAMPLAA